MTPFLLATAVSATLAAAAGLFLERACPRRLLSLRHALLLSALIVTCASPVLIFLARSSAIRVPQSWPASLSIAPHINPVARPPRQPVDVARGVPPAIGHAPTGGPATLPVNWAGNLLAAAWLAGSLVQTLRLIRGWRFLHRLARITQEVEPRVRAAADAAAQQLGLRVTPAVRWSPLSPTPLVVGSRAPRVLLPPRARDLSPDELTAVLLHEFAHVARGDARAGLLDSLARLLFWWCPPVPILTRRLSDLRESLCDAHVLACQGDPVPLASALVAVCEWAQQRTRPPRLAAATALGAAGRSGPALRRRIQSLLQRKAPAMLQSKFATRLTVASTGLLLCAAVLAINARAADAPIEKSALLAMLSDENFWQKTGGGTDHPEITFPQMAELRALAQSAESPAVRIRATKILRDKGGSTRVGPKLDPATAQAAIAAAFKYLEANLANPEVAKYAPECGFTHTTVSERTDDPTALWVLIENATQPETFSGGLNLRCDAKTLKITSVKQWGQTRPIPTRAKS